MTDTHKQEGFWGSKHEPHFPMPEQNEKPWDGQIQFIDMLQKVQSISEIVRYRGMSACRVCGKLNGCATHIVDNWEWPSGFMHYIEDHNVKPTDEFIKFIQEKS